MSLGDLLSFYARITRIGRTSISVHVEVYAERNPANLQCVKVTEANLTYVAIDGQGKPRPNKRSRSMKTIVSRTLACWVCCNRSRSPRV